MKKNIINLMLLLSIFAIPAALKAQKLEKFVRIVEPKKYIPVEYTKADGTVLVSHDNGLSWQNRETGVTVIGEKGYNLLYVRADGTMFETKDGGKTWEVHNKVKINSTVQSPPITTDNIELLGVLPQPATDYTQIEFRLLSSQHVTLTIFDSQGNQVVALLDSELSIGKYSIAVETWKLQTGVFYYHLSTGEKSFTGKISVVR